MHDDKYVTELEKKIKLLEEQLKKEKKIKESLIKKIEQDFEYNLNSASLFETNILLRQAVTERTNELEQANNKLKAEINERIKAESLLLESEKKFRTFFQLNIVGFVIYSTEGKWIIFNNQFANMLGYTKDELNEKSLCDIETEENYIEDIENIKKLVNNEIDGLEIERQYIKKDGTIIYVSVSAHVFSDEQTGTNFIASIVKDITDKVNIERERTIIQKRFQRFFKHIPVQICAFDSSYILTYVNPELCKYMGKQPEELLGKKFFDFIELQSNREYALNRIKRLTPNNPTETHDQVFTTPSGEISWQGWTNIAFFDKNGDILDYLAMGVDITDRILYESQIINAKENAEKSEKLKSEFLAQMSHEIRSPIYGILSYISLIKEHFLNKQTDEYFDEINESFASINIAANRIVRTIDLILNMSEIQTNLYNAEIINTNFKEILLSIYHEYNLKALNKNLTFTLNFQIDNFYLYLDEYSFTQIIVNLVDNAIKYTEKGEVSIIVKYEDDLYLSIDIMDTGIGISEEFQKKLFTPFSQEEVGYTRRFDGNGLGLALVKSYCEVNNAKIVVNSKKGEGSSFKVLFLR